MLAAASAPLYAAGSGQSAKDKEYLILVPLFNIGSGAGFSISGYMSVFDQLVGIIETELGLKVSFEFVGDADMSYDELSDVVGEALVDRGDLAFVGYNAYEKVVEKGAPLKPIMMPALNRSKTYNWCLYALKDSEFESTDDLKGRKFAATAGVDPLGLQEFRRMGLIDDEGENYEIIDVDNFQSQFYAIMMDEADFAWGPDYAVKLLKVMDSRFKRLKTIECSGDYYFDAMILYRTTVEKEIIDIAVDTLKNFTKMKGFQKIPYYSVFKKAGLSFIPFDENDVKALKKQSDNFILWNEEYKAWKKETGKE